MLGRRIGHSICLYLLTLWTFSVFQTIPNHCWAFSNAANNRDESAKSVGSLVKIEPLHPLCTHCSDGTNIQFPLLKSPSNDCFTGHYIRLPVNSTCHCQLVCAHTSRQACRIHSLPFENVPSDMSLCDKTLNLSCNERTNRCEGPLRLEIKKNESEARKLRLLVNWRKPKTIISQHDSQTASLLTHDSQSMPYIQIAEYISSDVSTARFFDSKAHIVSHGNAGERFHAEITLPESLSKAHVSAGGVNVLVRVTHGRVSELAIFKLHNSLLITTTTTSTTSTTTTITPSPTTLKLTTPLNIKASTVSPGSRLSSRQSNVSSLPKVLITAQTASSISIAFDDFKQFNDNRGYRILYRPLYGDDWSTHSANSSPFYVLNNLQPRTEYQIRVLTWDAEAISSEVISASTLSGCRHLNSTYEIDALVHASCERKCLCVLPGQVHCSPMCPEPLVSISAANSTGIVCASPSLSPSTSEHTSAIVTDNNNNNKTDNNTLMKNNRFNNNNNTVEQCCCKPVLKLSPTLSQLSPVSIQTNDSSSQSSSSSSSSSLSLPSAQAASISSSSENTFNGKPGDCPLVSLSACTFSLSTSSSSSSSSPVSSISSSSATSTVSADECSHDYHCEGLNKCCPNPCTGVKDCFPPTNVSTTFLSSVHQCHDCGAHATCQFRSLSTLLSSSSSSSSSGNNVIFDYSQHFLPLLSEQSNLKISKESSDSPSNTTPPTQYPICVCNEGFVDYVPGIGCSVPSPSSISLSSSPSSSLSSQTHHRCIHQNQTYSISETFFSQDNCQRCICSEALEIECQSKCTLSQNHPNPLPPGCTLEPHSEDPECCLELFCNAQDNVEKKKNRNTVNFLNVKDEKNNNKKNRSKSKKQHHNGNNSKNIEKQNKDKTVLVNENDENNSLFCLHNGIQYPIDQSFMLGCDLRCLCKNDRQVQCSPRCFSDPGYDERFCYLVADPDDPECCKISICDRSNATLLPTLSSFPIRATTTTTTTSTRTNFNASTGTVSTLISESNDSNSSSNQSLFINSSVIIVEMAEALNSTSIKLKLTVNTTLSTMPKAFNGIEGVKILSQQQKQTNLPLSIILSGSLLYSPVSPNETERDFNNRHWKTLKLSHDFILNNSESIIDVALPALQPETDYLIFFENSSLNLTSNTVFVRTFPIGINHTFRGCFHGSEIINVNETFYEGECEYKCICRDGGLRECEERCPVYVDLIGYESCHWEPSAEDACCQVPVCNHDPSDLFCTPTNGSKLIRYKLGEKWTEDLGGGCMMKRSCQCAMNSNGTAESRCKGGCPSIPISAAEPSPECPEPKIIRPKDPCICPYVVCDNNINPLDLPPQSDAEGHTIGQKIQSLNSSFCVFKGNQIAIGESYSDGCRAQCLCEQGGQLRCKPIQCSRTFGPHTTKCLEWDIDPHFVPTPGNCCPEPKCKNDGSCSFAGIRFSNRKAIPQELLPCGKRCICDNGEIYCENLCPEVPANPPPNLPCPASMAFRGHLPGDKCCIYWQCRDNHQHSRMKGECEYNNQRFKLGESWDEGETGLGRRCQCKLQNGILSVSCTPGNCQPITDRYLEPTSGCRVPQVIVPRDPIICPYVICNQTKAYAETGELENVDIVAINATSARVRFSIPTIFVGLLGHAEVHYTTDLQAPRVQWNIAKFARPKRMFDTPNIEYHLGSLRPDTTYFLQVSLVVEPLKSGPSSDIIRLYQPPLPATSTVSPEVKSPSSTLPPIIMLDMHLSARAIDSNSIRVSWRPFSSKEKKFIDGVQLRYKTNQAPDWSLSAVLHRSVTEHILSNLDPGSSYAVDIIFVTAEGITSNIVSSKPVVIDVPALPVSAYQFTPHIYADDVLISDDGTLQIEIHNLPHPVGKFINIAKLCYENIANGEIRYSFVAVDEKSRFTFSQLDSNTRYKMWIDLYLTNGQMVSSNAIDVFSKFNKNFNGNDIGALISLGQLDKSKFFFSAMLCSGIVFIAGAICMIGSCVFIRKHHSTAAISRPCITEAAYDNPTYKTFEVEKGCLEMSDTLSKSSTLPK